MVNYRAPPDQLAKTQLGQVSSWCRYDPVVCLAEVGVEAMFILLAYCSLLFISGGPVPGLGQVLKFLSAFGVLSVAARMVSDDLGNKLSITAVSGIGAKAVSLLAPKFVGW
jgi:hypothetical protein